MQPLTFPLESAFIALPLEGKAKLRFQELQKQLEPFSDFLRFQNPENPHLTIYFWRELLQIEYDDVLPKIGNIAAKMQPLTLRINGADTFGKKGNERVLLLTVAFEPKLGTLRKLCPWPNQPNEQFNPHITVARITHANKFSVYKKEIMKVFHGVSFDVNMDRLRLYAKIGDEKQTPLQDFTFTAA